MKTKLIALAIAASQLHLCAGSDRPDKYAAHEWGTFTSVQGADGQLIQWHPLSSSKLPAFVYDRTKPSGHPRLRYASGKDDYSALQRMETPVIYFYSDRERKLDVTVRFPKGLITEWYPWAEGIGPSWVQPLPMLTKLDSAVRLGKAIADLSAKELKLLRLFHSHPGEVLSRDRLLSEVWGYNYYGTTRTLDQAIVQLRRKIGDSGSEPRRILTVHGVGYKLVA